MKRIIFTLVFLSLITKLAAQLPNTDIWLLDVKEKNNELMLENPLNITNREGYDNQPTFSPKGSYILYTSIREDNQADIYKYNISTKKTTRFTKTLTSEYSPTYMPDGKNISVVMVEKDSSQRLWKFPINGGRQKVILDKIKNVGYHCWINKDSVALFVLPEPFTLQITDIKIQSPIIIADSIGRSIKKTPGQNSLMFIKKQSPNNWAFQTLHLKTLKILSDVPGRDIKTIPGSEDFIFTKRGLLMCKDSKVFSYSSRGEASAEWYEIADLSKFGINNITRIAISNDNKKIAIVTSK